MGIISNARIRSNAPIRRRIETPLSTPIKHLLSRKDAAVRLGVSTRTISRMADRYELASVQVGRRILIVAESVDRYIAAHLTSERNRP